MCMSDRLPKASRAVLALALLALSACDGSGICEGTYGSGSLGGTECHDGWSADDCAKFDTQLVNGSHWTFHDGQTCAARGYSIQCCYSNVYCKPNGSWVPCK